MARQAASAPIPWPSLLPARLLGPIAGLYQSRQGHRYLVALQFDLSVFQSAPSACSGLELFEQRGRLSGLLNSCQPPLATAASYAGVILLRCR